MNDELAIASGPVMRIRVVALFIVALVIVFTLVYLLTRGGSEFFQKQETVVTYMSDASGLAKDASVRLNGVIIGRIGSVNLTDSLKPRRVVRVSMKIFEPYVTALPVDSVAGISADDVLGDKYINITRGKAVEHVRAGSELPSEAPTPFNSADLLANLKANLNSVDAIITQIESGQTATGKFIFTDEIYQGVRKQIVAVQNAIQSYASPKSEIGKALYSQDLYRQLRQPILDLDKTLAGIERGEGAAGRWMNDPSMYDDTRKKISDVRQSLADLNAGQGQFGKLLKDDEMYRQMQKVVRALGEAIDNINTGGSQVGQLLNSAQLYESLNGSTRELQVFMGEFRANPQKFLRLKVF